MDKCDYYEGYWQSEKYFREINDIIKMNLFLKNTNRFEINAFKFDRRI
jgi:hypothetical protein